jgi:hypothetical protein
MQGLLELNSRVVVDEVEPSELRTREVNRRIDVGDLRDVDPQADSLAACRMTFFEVTAGSSRILSKPASVSADLDILAAGFCRS